MPRGQPINLSLALNTAKVCAMNGCEKPRHKLAKHCRQHDERRRRWGTPRGRCWRAGDIGTYADVAEDFITANADHVGIKAAVDWLDAVLEAAAERTKQPFAGLTTRAFSGLHGTGVNGHRLLVRCVAVTLYLTELPEGEQELEPFVRNLGHYCLRPVVPALAKGERQRQYSQSLGNFLYSQLSKLLVHIVAPKRKHDLAKKAFDNAAKEPFVGE